MEHIHGTILSDFSALALSMEVASLGKLTT